MSQKSIVLELTLISSQVNPNFESTPLLIKPTLIISQVNPKLESTLVVEELFSIVVLECQIGSYVLEHKILSWLLRTSSCSHYILSQLQKFHASTPNTSRPRYSRVNPNDI